jgi:hypothetical protein
MNYSTESIRSKKHHAEKVKLIIGGKVQNSTIVIGDSNNLRIDRSNEKPKIRPLPSSMLSGVSTKPVDLLDREFEREFIGRTLSSGSSAEIYSSEGFGKTILLEYFSHHLSMPNGKVHLIAKGKSLDEILLELFRSFYSCNLAGYTPSQTEYRIRFGKIRALILLDDITLTRNEVEALMGYLPACAILFTSIERIDLRMGEIVHLNGLPADAALSLFTKKIGRNLNEEEAFFARKICDALNRNPLYIVQVAGDIKHDEKPLEIIWRKYSPDSFIKTFYDRVLGATSMLGRHLLSLLTALGGSPLSEEHIAGMLAADDARTLITTMLERGYIKAHSPRYSISEELGSSVKQLWAHDVSVWKEKSISYFSEWTSRALSDEQILDSRAVIELAAHADRWKEVLQICRAIEPVFIVKQQWGVWLDLLNYLMRASQALGDRFIEAWVFHQLGSRALCLENFSEARDLLSRALEIRRAIGDDIGMAASQHNLDQMAGGLLLQKSLRRKNGSGWIFQLLGLGTLVALIISGESHLQQRTEIETTVMAKRLVSATPSLPVINSPTLTPSHTPKPTATHTAIPLISPTVTGLVNVNCRYVPSFSEDEKDISGTLRKGQTVDVIGKTPDSTWLLVRHPTYTDSSSFCWVANGRFIDLKGNLDSVSVKFVDPLSSNSDSVHPGYSPGTTDSITITSSPPPSGCQQYLDEASCNSHMPDCGWYGDKDGFCGVPPD